MALIDVSNNPLNVVVQLYFNLLNDGATQNSQYQQASQSLINALKFLPSNLQSQLAPITPFLQTPLGSLFNSAWAGERTAAENFGAGQLQSTAKGGGTSVSNVSCTLAPSGTVLASVTPGQGANPAGLVIDFHLPGGAFRFNNGTPGARWRIDFDADVTVTTVVPTLPFSLAPVAQVTLSNASMHPDNFAAGFDQFIDDLFTAIGNFFTNGNYIATVDWDEQVYAQQTDQTQNLPPNIAAPLLSLFNALNAAGPECVSLGFLQCAFSIAGNSTLTLTITHPRDPGPTLDDANHPQGVLMLPPTLAATSNQALPGGPVTAIGGRFPVDTTTSLNLQWPNTASGTPTQAQVRYNGVNYPVQAPAGAQTNLVYTYSPTGLTKGTSYMFEARCGDAVTWSDWGPAFTLATLSTNLVDLVLTPVGGGQMRTLGHAPLPPANGTWTCMGTVPGSVPTGLYNLEARLAGTLLAETQINIVTTLSPVIEVVDPATLAIISPPIFDDQPFTLRGTGFPDGPVAINFDGKQVAAATASAGVFMASLATPTRPNPYVDVTVNVTAVGGAVTAMLSPPIFLQALAK